MKKEPPVDRRGSSLTPGERFQNWVDGAVKIWPIILPLLAGTVWGNSETVRNFVTGKTLDPVDGIHQPANGDFEQQVRDSISDIVKELKRQKAKDTQLQSQLQSQDTENYESLESMIEITRAEVQQIRELVQ